MSQNTGGRRGYKFHVAGAGAPPRHNTRGISGATDRREGRREEGGWTDLVELYRSLPSDSAETLGNPSPRRRPFVDPRPTLGLFIRGPSPLVEGKMLSYPNPLS